MPYPTDNPRQPRTQPDGSAKCRATEASIEVSGPPAAAFRNLRRALRPGGRLVMMVWQAHERNEWIVAIHRSLDAADAPVADASEELIPFSLADPPAVTEILEAAGFTDITFTDICEPVYYGADIAAALDWVRGFTCTSETLKRLDPAATEHAVRRLRDTLAAHTSDDGVRFNSRAWLVTHRPEFVDLDRYRAAL